MEKFNPDTLKISPEAAKEINERLASLKAAGFEFTVVVPPDSYTIRMKDEKGQEIGFGFTKSFASADLIEARIRNIGLSPSEALEALKKSKKDSVG